MTHEVNYEALIERVKENDETLNTEPLHEGQYNYVFVKDGTQYNFSSDGWTWTWKYFPTDAEDTI